MFLFFFRLIGTPGSLNPAFPSPFSTWELTLAFLICPLFLFSQSPPTKMFPPFCYQFKLSSCVYLSYAQVPKHLYSWFLFCHLAFALSPLLKLPSCSSGMIAESINLPEPSSFLTFFDFLSFWKLLGFCNTALPGFCCSAECSSFHSTHGLSPPALQTEMLPPAPTSSLCFLWL